VFHLGKIIVSVMVIVVIVVTILAAILRDVSLLPSGNQSAAPVSGGWAGSSVVVQDALTIQAKLSGSFSTIYTPTDPLMERLEGYWQSYCSNGVGGLCSLATSGNLQCVEFVSGVYWLAGDPLPVIANAEDFWPDYAQQKGWQEIPSPSSFPVAFVPPQPGDLMVWQGGGYDDANGVWQEDGHIAIVVGYEAPRGTQSGFIEVAQANAEGNVPLSGASGSTLYRMTVQPDGVIDTWGPWVDANGVQHSGYRVLGFIRPTSPPQDIQDTTGTKSTPAPTGLPAGLSWNTPYVQYAWDAAQQAGISPAIFVRQIQQESGFNPNAKSAVGAEGIAQFMPATAAGIANPLGAGTLNPWNPDEALVAAAHYMAAAVQMYGGDYAKALAAYNAGDGGVQTAVAASLAQTGTATGWQSYLPQETQTYLRIILGT
jgi:hypothetical protein